MYSHQHLNLHEKRKKNHVSTFNKHWQLVLQELFKVTSKFLGAVWVNFPQPVGISKGCTWCMLCQRDPLYIFNNACHESGSTAGHSVREVRQLKKNWRQHLGDKQTNKKRNRWQAALNYPWHLLGLSPALGNEATKWNCDKPDMSVMHQWIWKSWIYKSYFYNLLRQLDHSPPDVSRYMNYFTIAVLKNILLVNKF